MDGNDNALRQALDIARRRFAEDGPVHIVRRPLTELGNAERLL
jgi:hypothetical protein